MNWRKIAAWTFAAIVIATLCVTGGVVWLTKSQRFMNYAVRKIGEEVHATTGAETKIGRLELNLSTLTARLYDITLYGTEGATQPPLLHVDKLTVKLKLQSILHPTVRLREMLIDHPVVHLSTDHAGQTNLPQQQPRQSEDRKSVFDLGVEHVRLTDGEINYNDRKTPFQADLYGLGTDIRFESLPKRYRGGLYYSSGHFQYAGYSSLQHTFKVIFNATPSQLVFEHAALRVGKSELTFRGAMSGYSNPAADGDYEIRLHAQDFASMSPSAAPAGDVFVTGKLHYQTSQNVSLLQSIATSGRITCPRLHVASEGSTLEVQKLQAQYELSGNTLTVRDVRLSTMGGTIAGDARIEQLDANPAGRIRASLHDISLRAAQQSLHRPELKDTMLSGALNGTTAASWKNSLQNIRAQVDLMVRAGATSQSSGNAVPVDAAIHGTYDGARQSVSLQDTSVRIPSATLTAQGEISNHSNLQVRFLANDLHQLAGLVAAYQGMEIPTVSGSASFNARVHGSMGKPEIDGQFIAQHLQLQGSEWNMAQLDLQASPSQLTIRKGSLVSAHKGQASFDARIGLQNWSYLNSSPIEASLSAEAIEIDDLLRLANQHYPVSGTVSAQLKVRGTQLNPVGSGSIHIASARAYDEPIQNLTLHFQAENGSIASSLNLAALPGKIEARLSYTPGSGAYKVALDSSAIALQKLRTLQARNLQLAGALNISANGEGTLENPQLKVIVQSPQLELHQRPLGSFKAEAQVANQQADVTVVSNISEALVKAHGRVNLSNSYYTEAAIDTTAIPLDRLLADYAQATPGGIQGQTELHATLKGPLATSSQMEAHLSIPTLSVSYESLQLGIANPLRADYSRSVLTLQPVEIRGTGTSIRLQGSVPLVGESTPNFSAQGSIDVGVLRMLAPDLHSSGLVAVDVRTSGPAVNPSVQGQVRVENVSLFASDPPLGVQNVNGKLDINTNQVQISDMRGQMGGGDISIRGSVTYRPKPQFNIAVQGQGMRLRYPQGLRMLLDTTLSFSGTTEASNLSGRVIVDSLSFAPEFDLAKFSDQFSNGTTTPAQPGFADTVRLAINVQSKEDLNATSSQVSLGGKADLRVTGTAADPVITGRTSLTSGELFYRNVRYELQRGMITFDDPNQTHPVMDVSATTNVEQYNLTLTLRGPLDKLTVSYASDPPLATADIINLIARGKTTQEANATSQSTDSIIASGAASELSSSVQKLAGISSLQIDPLLGGNNQNPSARVAIQQRVSRNLLFSFSTDVSQPGTEVVQGEYQITKRWSASVTRDQLGGVSVDGKFHTKF